MKKRVYYAQIVLTRTTNERIHLAQEYYYKTKQCGLFSGAASAVATGQEVVSES